ncbi:MAG: family 43 glycosylhydrolase [Clostridia bacterium]|nr:family 43 glycosylhydrolase [Clostridia bacterium]
MEKKDCFYPGQPWLDTDGNRIQAHGGYMFYENDTFYWYGENKEKSQSEWEIWHWGVRLYSSKDLYNWKSEGIILPPELEDETSPVYYNAKMDRPHILYNEKTGLYVMWVKVMTCASAGFAAIATSKSIKGPFTLVKKQYFPNGFEFGDYEIVKHGDKAYCIYEKPHTELIITPLTDDYLGVEEENYNSYFHYKFPPYVREAPATFVHNGKIYMITSGTTGKFPNPSEAAVADSYMGDWKVLGDPHVNDAKKTSFDSQISCIFKHPKKKNLFIAMADRWLTDLPENMPDICDIFDSIFNPDREPIQWSMGALTKKNTSLADYVWLPIEFDGEKPIIKWYDNWRWEDFE